MSGRDLLLDYAFPIEAIEALAEPSTAYLNRVCVVAKPKSGQEGNVGTIYQCLNMTAVAVRTDNTNAQQLFNAGMTQVYVLLADDLDLSTFLETANTFFTLLISDDFDDNEIADGASTPAVKASRKIEDITYTAKTAGTAGNSISITLVDDGTAGAETVVVTGSAIVVHMEDGASTADNIRDAIEAEEDADALVDLVVDSGDENDVQSAQTILSLTGGAAEIAGTDGIDVGDWNGVIGVSSSDLGFVEDQAVITKRTSFFVSDANGAKSLFFAFGELLSDRDWKNQQYIEMPVNDGVDTLGEAQNLYDLKASFVLNSAQYGNRLALFTNNRKAIVAPYISELFQISMQGWGVAYIAQNQPAYTVREASLLQDYLKEQADKTFIDTGLVESLSVKISLVNNNFTANGDLVIAEPKALWRVNAVLTESA